MKKGDKYLRMRDSKVYTLAGFSTYTSDGVYLQTESKQDDCEFVGTWYREMKDDSGKEFTCAGYALDIKTSHLMDVECFKKVVVDTDSSSAEIISELRQEVAELKYYRDSTVGLWATDKPDYVLDYQKVLFELKY